MRERLQVPARALCGLAALGVGKDDGFGKRGGGSVRRIQGQCGCRIAMSITGASEYLFAGDGDNRVPVEQKGFH